jgi:thymidylate synthase
MKIVSDIRREFIEKYLRQEFVIDKTGVKTVEIIAAHFVVDDAAIFGKPNLEYIERELQWYQSQSLSVNDIPGKVPEIWKQVASKDGLINSNYGYCIWSKENGDQYNSCLNELKRNPDSRRGTMIYTRPSMQVDYCKDGMSDFMCTFATQHLIRDGKLISIVMMRSNDSVFGFNNDAAWQLHVHHKLARDLNVEVGDLIWNANSLHVYERHFKFIDEWIPHT